jgi:anti-anti-sigma factor
MDLSVSSHESITVLHVDGDIDMASAPALESSIESRSDSYQSPVLLDLTLCPFMDSGGLNVLLQAVRQFDGHGWIGVLGANRNLRRVFEIVGLTADPRFRLLEDLSDLSA